MKTERSFGNTARFLADLGRLAELKPTFEEHRFRLVTEPKSPKVREQPWYRKGQRW